MLGRSSQSTRVYAHVHHKYNSINQGLTHHTVYGIDHNHRSSQERAANGRMAPVFRRCNLLPANFIRILLPFTLYPLPLVQSRFPNQNRSPCRQSDLNHLPIVARVRQHRTSSSTHHTRLFSLHFLCMCMLSFCHLKLCFGRTVPITTNIEILARSAQFVGEGLLHQADSVTCALTRLHALSRMRVIVALMQLLCDTLRMHAIVDVFSSGGSA
jgi:hypothetical protein